MRQANLLLKLFSFLIKNPKAFLLIFVLGALFYSYEVFVARDKMVYMGIPVAKEFSLNLTTRILRNEAYMVGYSDIRGNPLWVAYKLKHVPYHAPHLKRPDNFSMDIRNLTFIKSSDYTNSGYDRGHMAPNHAISVLYGKAAQEETFLMTNITPQKANLNQKIWQKLEEMELNKFTEEFKEVWVYTGPIFNKETQRLKSSFFVEIPDAFYKIFIGIKEDKSVRALSFIMPQTVKPHDRIEKYMVSINEIEKQSGFDFLHELEDTMEEKIESEVERELWF
ncbi:MAG: DNA/RNA non-specific endonuclease [Campylobacteraceae bacterium]|nr:DNA/RNA non-specific endonuclease [Campylobacteraceae bacterium]